MNNQHVLCFRFTFSATFLGLVSDLGTFVANFWCQDFTHFFCNLSVTEKHTPQAFWFLNVWLEAELWYLSDFENSCQLYIAHSLKLHKWVSIRCFQNPFCLLELWLQKVTFWGLGSNLHLLVQIKLPYVIAAVKIQSQDVDYFSPKYLNCCQQRLAKLAKVCWAA